MAKLFRCESDGKHGDIFMYGTIGGGWFGGVTAEEVAKEMNEMGSMETISIHVNSLGGDVFEGIAMRSTFMKSNAEIDVAIDGIAASAATVAIAIPDVPVVMADGARYMIHNPWGVAVGEAGEMRKTADLLDSIRGDLIDIYESRTDDLSPDEIGEMMDSETWLSVEEAIEHGFATDVGGELAIAACVCPAEIREKLKNAPIELLTPEKEEPQEADEKLKCQQTYSRLLMSKYRVARAKSR
jgi:ATP-dependent protease ClpP protease subunit